MGFSIFFQAFSSVFNDQKAETWQALESIAAQQASLAQQQQALKEREAKVRSGDFSTTPIAIHDICIILY